MTWIEMTTFVPFAVVVLWTRSRFQPSLAGAQRSVLIVGPEVCSSARRQTIIPGDALRMYAPTLNGLLALRLTTVFSA